MVGTRVSRSDRSVCSTLVRQSHNSPPFTAQQRKQCAFVSCFPGQCPLVRHPLQPPLIACALKEHVLFSAYLRKSPSCWGPPLMRCARMPVVILARALSVSVEGACVSPSVSSRISLPLLVYRDTVWLIGVSGMASQLCCMRTHSMVSRRVAEKQGSLMISVSLLIGFS